MWNVSILRCPSRLLIFVLSVMLLCSCKGALVKEAAKDFDKATRSAVDGTTGLVVQYDYEQVWKEAEDNMELNIVHADIAGVLAYDGQADTVVRVHALRSLKLYADALATLASVGSPKANSDALAALGKSIEQAGAENSETYGKLIGTLAGLITDAKIGASVQKLTLEADDTVQELAALLSYEIGQIAPTIRTNLNERYTALRNIHTELGCPSQCNEAEILRATELLLEMNRINKLRAGIPDRREKAQETLEALAKAHSALAKGARGKDKALLVDSITSYIKAANELQDLLDKLES